MKKHFLCAAILGLLALSVGRLTADDTCIFAVTADDVPPNVLLLLDTGAEMEYIVEHSGYDPAIDYTPSVGEEIEGSNGFFNSRGYVISEEKIGGKIYFYLRPIVDSSFNKSTTQGAATPGEGTTWSINGRTLNLPKYASSTVDANGIKDNQSPKPFRYSKNYLNYLFFGDYTDHSSVDNGTDLPAVSRLYMAKKAIFQMARQTANKAKFGLYHFIDTPTRAQPIKMVVQTPLAANPAENILSSEFVNNVNNMASGTYSPLARGLSFIGSEFESASFGWNDYDMDAYCQKNFAMVISAGVPSEPSSLNTKSVPATPFSDFDGDASGIGEGKIKINENIYDIPVNVRGTTYLDDIATYLYEHDIPKKVEGYQNLYTYTVGVMATEKSRAFLANTSNNGNGNKNLYNADDPEYGKFHFDADSPDAIADALIAALNSILSRTATFTAPVVPVTRTASGDYIYLAFFKPLEGNFWEGNITKFGLNTNNEIVDKNGAPATWPNGAMRETAEPYWATRDWADSSKGNHMANGSRDIYTYLGANNDLTATANQFSVGNDDLTPDILGTPVKGSSPRDNLINYIRGADSYDEDQDANITENRRLITGDALHVEPAVFAYSYRKAASLPTLEFRKLFYGANDGMLHTVNDDTGIEDWGFVPPGQLSRLKMIVEGTSHEYFVDSSPRLFFLDYNNDGVIDDLNGDGSVDEGDDRVILIFGERKGGSSYYALDVTYPDTPIWLWRLNASTTDENGVELGTRLGETWSEPVFGRVKTSDDENDAGTWVMFVGGGYGLNDSKGNSILAVNALSGAVVRSFHNTASNNIGMNYSIISNITTVDADPAHRGHFVDKLYVGDLGGNLWRIGNFSSSNFYFNDENIHNWQAQILFKAGCDESSCSDNVDNDGDGLTDERRQFQYAPDVTLEWGYDLVFIGSGDRDKACQEGTANRFYAVKDNHLWTALTEEDLVNLRPAADTSLVPRLDNPSADIDQNNISDKGWYYTLGDGEKVLAEPVVFNKAVYFTTFSPNDEVCVPGGDSYLYALGYKTGAAVFADYDSDGVKDDYREIGGGIGSKPVLVIKDGSQRLLISVGSTNPDEDSESTNAGVFGITPDFLPHNFFFIWWRELFQ